MAIVVTLTSGTSWLVPPYLTMTVEVFGSAGSGAGCSAYPSSLVAGNSGGATSVSTLSLTANGGAGGSINGSTSAGGTASGGNAVNTTGNAGGAGVPYSSGNGVGPSVSGAGGNAPNGGAGGAAVTANSGSPQLAGNAGVFPGGGGSGFADSYPLSGGSHASGGGGASGGYTRSNYTAGAGGAPVIGSTLTYAIGAGGATVGAAIAGGAGAQSAVVITYVPVPVATTVDSFTKLLLHCDGADGSTSFSDASASNHTVTVNGGVAIRTAQSKFGGASGSFKDGASTAALVLDGSNDFAFGSGDFTIDFWVRFRTVGLTVLYDPRGGVNGPTPLIYINTNTLIYHVNGADRITGATVLATGVWYHVAVARSGTSTKLFLNGVQEGATWTDSTTYTIAAGLPMIGGNPSAPVDGYLDEIRVSKGIARWTANFTPPTAPYAFADGDANTSLLLHCNGANGATSFPDSSGKNHVVTPAGTVAVSTATSEFDGASAAFNGAASDFLYVDGSSDFAFGTGDFTIDLWFRMSAVPFGTTKYSVLYDGRPGSTSGPYPTIYIDGTSTPTLKYYTNSADQIVGGTVALNTWYHVAVARSGTSTRLFVNGVQQGATFTDANNYAIGGGRPVFGISGYSGADLIFAGNLDEIRVSKGLARWTANFTPPTSPYGPVSGILVASEAPDSAWFTDFDPQTVLLLHCDGANGSTAFPDTSGRNHTVTRNGTVTVATAQSQFGGASGIFNGGASDYLSLDGSNDFAFGTGDFTIDLWFRMGGVPTGSPPYSTLYDARPPSTSGPYPTIYIDGTSTPTLKYYTNSADQIVGGTVALNTWYHVAVARSGTSTKLFLNGVQQGATFTDANSYGIGGGRPIFGVGGYGAPPMPFTGYLDEIRVSRGVARWTANFTPPSAPYLDAITGTLAATEVADTALFNVSVTWDGDANTILLLHCDGANGSGSFVDQSGWTPANTVTPTGVTVSNAQAKFNQSAINTGAANAHISVAPSTNYDFGAANFTIDFWFRLAATPTTALSIVNRAPGGSFGVFNFYVAAGGTNLTVYLSSNGTAWNIGNISAGNLSLNAWYHVALVRNGTTFTLYLNGNSVGTPITSSAALFVNATALSILGASNGADNGSVTSYVDEFRVSNVARWTANFTPPTGPYPFFTPITGTLAATEAADTALFGGFGSVIGVIAATEAADAALFAGVVGTVGLDVYSPVSTGLVHGGASISVTLSTTQTDLIVAVVATTMNDGNGTSNTSTVSGGGLTWTLRKRATWTTSGGFPDVLEVWTAPASGPLSSQTITATFSRSIGGTSYGILTAFGLFGLDTASPYDANASVPGFATNSGAASVPGAAISTSNALDLIIDATFGTPTTNWSTAAGATQIYYEATNKSQFVEYRTVAAPQSSVTFANGGAGTNWGFIVDAFRILVSGPTGTLAAIEAADTAAFAGSVVDAPITGTLAATESADTAAFVGGVATTGILAATEAADTAAFVGTVTTTGILAAIEADDSSLFVGTLIATGTLVAVEASDAALLAGGVFTNVTGTLAAVEAADTAAFAGSGVASGTLAAIEAADTASFAGDVATIWRGTLDATDAPDTSLIFGTVIWTGILAAVEATPDTAAFTGVAGWGSVLAATESADVGLFTGAAEIFGAFDATELRDTATFTGGLSWSAVLDATDAPDIADFSAIPADFGPLVGVEVQDSAAFAGFLEWDAVLAATDAPDSAAFVGTISSAAILAANEAPDIVLFSGINGWTGNFALIEDTDVATFSGLVAWPATLAAIDVTDTAAFIGNIANPDITGTLAASETPDGAAFFAGVVASGILVASDGDDTAAFAGKVAWNAVLAATENADTASFMATAQWNAFLVAMEAPDAILLTGDVAWGAILAATEGADTARFRPFAPVLSVPEIEHVTGRAWAPIVNGRMWVENINGREAIT